MRSPEETLKASMVIPYERPPASQFAEALTLRSRAQPASLVPVAISSPTDVTEIRPLSIPSETRYLRTAWPRRSPSAMLYSYFRRGFRTPTSIPTEELQKLTCVLELSITEDGRVEGYEITRPSGNESFDAAVRRRVDDAEGAELPTPPASIANQVLGNTISLRFFGRHFD